MTPSNHEPVRVAALYKFAALGDFDRPFQAASREASFATLDGERGRSLAAQVAGATAYRVLGFWDNGIRHISNGERAIRTPADCFGLRLRTLDNAQHQTAFRRLEYKTQVFVNHEGDLFRTRLTHSLEVAQIARSVARNLRVNEDLVEAISLAHDLGHTPFGHAGQDALNECMREHGG